MKKQRLTLQDIAKSNKRVGAREVRDAELKLIAGGQLPDQDTGGTCSTSGDSDA